jgi:hypothetical protein
MDTSKRGESTRIEIGRNCKREKEGARKRRVQKRFLKSFGPDMPTSGRSSTTSLIRYGGNPFLVVSMGLMSP